MVWYRIVAYRIVYCTHTKYLFPKVVFKNTLCVGGGWGHLSAFATDANALNARALTIITGVQTFTRLITTGTLTALMATVDLLIGGERVGQLPILGA